MGKPATNPRFTEAARSCTCARAPEVEQDGHHPLLNPQKTSPGGVQEIKGHLAEKLENKRKKVRIGIGTKKRKENKSDGSDQSYLLRFTAFRHFTAFSVLVARIVKV